MASLSFCFFVFGCCFFDWLVLLFVCYAENLQYASGYARVTNTFMALLLELCCHAYSIEGHRQRDTILAPMVIFFRLRLNNLFGEDCLAQQRRMH